ncbi:MAG: putative toxin-antitoxin system toxin component, PIN family, partial [Flavobacterium sp.]
MKKVVLDTNVLLVSISTKSKLHWIFKNLLEGNYILCITTEILAEYAEIIDQQMGTLASESALGLLENLPNVELITNYYKFNLLKDPDDNKFVDCAISSNADFSILKKIEFPKVTII